MHRLAENLFYSFSAVVLGAALFVMQPAANPETAQFKNYIKDEFKTAAIQVFGDQPVFEGVELVVNGIFDFYDRSADAAVAMLAPAASESDMVYVAQGVYDRLVLAFGANFAQPKILGIETSQITIPENFMKQEPVYNIVPPGFSPKPAAIEPAALPAPPTPYVESAFTRTISQSGDDFVTAVNDNGSTWVNLRDKVTGQVYCVAIFNAEVNRYLGPCRNDYY